MFMKITFHNNLLLFIAILKLQTYKFEIKEKFTYFKVAQTTLKKFLESAESYLIEKNSMVNNKYTSQIGEKNMHFWIKNYDFQKNDSVYMNKIPKRIQTCDLRFASQIF